MTVIAAMLTEAGFTRELTAASTGPGIVIIHRSAAAGRYASGITDRNAADARRVQACLDALEERVGLEIVDASIFCSAARTTMLAKFPLPGSDAVLAIYHEAGVPVVDAQILHPETLIVSHGSASDLMMAHADPWRMLDIHLGTAAGQARDILQRIGLMPVASRTGDLQYDTHVLPLRWSI